MSGRQSADQTHHATRSPLGDGAAIWRTSDRMATCSCGGQNPVQCPCHCGRLCCGACGVARNEHTICNVCASVEIHVMYASPQSVETQRVLTAIATGRAFLRIYTPADGVSAYADLMPVGGDGHWRIAATMISRHFHDKKWYATISECDGNMIASAGPYDTEEDARAALRRCIETRTIIGWEPTR